MEDDFMKGVVYVVEATHNEKMHLWLEWHCNHEGITWDDNSSGLSVVIGDLADMPVAISLFKADILGQTVLFWELTSQVQDYRMAEEWLKENVEAHSMSGVLNDHRPCRTDVSNFSHCMSYLMKNRGKSYKDFPRIWDISRQRPAR